MKRVSLGEHHIYVHELFGPHDDALLLEQVLFRLNRTGSCSTERWFSTNVPDKRENPWMDGCFHGKIIFFLLNKIHFKNNIWILVKFFFNDIKYFDFLNFVYRF